MASLQPVRGTHDILAEEFRLHKSLTDTAAEVASRYGFREMTTPIFEFTEVFSRTLGDTSDIVTKEMYTFEDRGGESVTLRPEFTAGIARAFMSNGMAHETPVKTFSRGPVFRRERPQKGRLRQFHQVNVETIGVAEPLADIEIISVGAHILDAIGLADAPVLNINTLGDPESRQAYRAALVTYFEKYENDLSDDSRDRLRRNPLRILDSKDPGDIALVADAPEMKPYLNADSQGFFDAVLGGLEELGIAYVINPFLVRGLDYYTHTAFEFIAPVDGSNLAVLAGGRYDGLIKTMGGPPTPGVGWAAGVERLAMIIGVSPPARRPVAMIPVGAEAQAEALKLTDRLRHAGFAVELGYSGNMKKRMVRANKAGAVAAVLIGEDELAKNVATIRDMETGEQTEAPLASLEDHLARYR